MLNHRLTWIMVVALGLGACGKKSAEPERQGGTPAPAADAASQVGVSTAGRLGGMLNAPGNYMRGMDGKADKARQAAEFSSQKTQERMNVDSAGETGN